MNAKVITHDESGKPKRVYFTDVVDSCSCNNHKPEPDHDDTDTTLSDQAREKMIKRAQDAWKE